MITSYKGTKLKTFDRRLLRGLFIKNLKDFDEEYKEQIQNMSLLDRIQGALLNQPSHKALEMHNKMNDSVQRNMLN
jgi:hypothetical protein